MMPTPPDHHHSGDLVESLRRLEQRISRIEEHLELGHPEECGMPAAVDPATRAQKRETDSLEFQIGQFWLSRAGILVLVIGLAFLLTFPYEGAPGFLPVLLGYLFATGFFGFSRYWRNTYADLSRCLLGGAMFLFFFSTLRLHYFGASSVLANPDVERVLLLAVVAVNLAGSVRCRSVYLVAMNLTLGYVTALLGATPYYLFLCVLVWSGLFTFFKLRYGWNKLLLYGISLAYAAHALWAVNLPVLGNKVELVLLPRANLFFILAYGLVFALGHLLEAIGDDPPAEGDVSIVGSVFNCAGCYGLYLVLTLASGAGDLAGLHLLASGLFLVLSMLFWIRRQSRYHTFFYAMLGYAALTVAIVAKAPRPDVFMWLCWQSLLVISTAIWFRSKFIILANIFIYAGIFLAYLSASDDVSVISFSFGVVALLSARILNWQKHRLMLETEAMRISYLVCAFFIFPYTLWQLVPGGYVGVSWVGIALVYYLLSLLLHNKRYRWMALLTLLLTVLYVFVVGITRLDPAYRIVSFIVLGVVLLLVSLIYTRIRIRKERDEG